MSANATSLPPNVLGQASISPHPWTVLVRNRTVFGVYNWGCGRSDAQAALRYARNSNLAFRIYDVDGKLPEPPEVGSIVDAEALGWVEVDRF